MRCVFAHFEAWVAGALLLGCTSLMGIDHDYALEQSNGASGGSPSGGAGGIDAQNGGAPTGGSVTSGGVLSSSGGGEPSGGKSGTGGDSEETGGAGGSTGGAGSGGGAGGIITDCPSGQKLCTVNDEAQCVVPDPSVGCGPTSCEQCVAPAGGFGMCEGTACGFGCFDGFTKKNGACVAVPPPDAGSPTGTGGRPTTCRQDADCEPCSREIGGCCSLVPPGRCGCNFVWCVPTLP